jgi:hypothetical protein
MITKFDNKLFVFKNFIEYFVTLFIYISFVSISYSLANCGIDLFPTINVREILSKIDFFRTSLFVLNFRFVSKYIYFDFLIDSLSLDLSDAEATLLNEEIKEKNYFSTTYDVLDTSNSFLYSYKTHGLRE